MFINFSNEKNCQKVSALLKDAKCMPRGFYMIFLRAVNRGEEREKKRLHVKCHMLKLFFNCWLYLIRSLLQPCTKLTSQNSYQDGKGNSDKLPPTPTLHQIAEYNEIRSGDVAKTLGCAGQGLLSLSYLSAHSPFSCIVAAVVL